MLKISVVIPSYNSGKYLLRTLNSIFDQEYPNLEVIVVDGYSNDNSLDIIMAYQKYHPNLILQMTKTEGIVEHINLGLKLATGDIIAWLCADDTYQPLSLGYAASCFLTHRNVQWVYGRVKIIDSEGNEVRGLVTALKELLQTRYSYTAIQCASFISEPSVFMRKSFYTQIGEYNKKWTIAADYEYWVRAGRLSRPMFVNRHQANWRAHGKSTSINNYKAQMRQVFQIQQQYTGWWLRPLQLLIWQSVVLLYGVLNSIQNPMKE